jgi:hypothetical protein
MSCWQICWPPPSSRSLGGKARSVQRRLRNRSHHLPPGCLPPPSGRSHRGWAARLARLVRVARGPRPGEPPRQLPVSIHMSWSGREVVWRSLTPEGIDSTEQVSPKLGSGDYAQISPDVQTIRAKPDTILPTFSPMCPSTQAARRLCMTSRSASRSCRSAASPARHARRCGPQHRHGGDPRACARPDPRGKTKRLLPVGPKRRSRQIAKIVTQAALSDPQAQTETARCPS